MRCQLIVQRLAAIWGSSVLQFISVLLSNSVILCVFFLTNDSMKKHSESLLSLFCHPNGWNIMLWSKYFTEMEVNWRRPFLLDFDIHPDTPSISVSPSLSFPLSRGQHVEHIRGLSVTSLNALVLCRCEDGIKRQLDCSEGWCLCYKVKSAEDGRTEQGIEVEHTSEGKRAEKKLICTKRGRATETKWHASQADSPSVITSTPLHRKQLRNTWARSACIMAYYKPAQPNICTKIINILQTDPKWIRLQNKQCSTCVVPTVTALFFLC